MGASASGLACGTVRHRCRTSVITVMEIVDRPILMDRPDVADQYDVLLGAHPNLLVADVNRAAARRAADLRATYRLRPADALQVAACLEHGTTTFLTNDRDLRRVAGIQVLLLDDFVEPAEA